VAGAGVLCALGALNGWMLIGGRIAYGAAQDGIFPKVFLKKDKYGAPSASIIISSLCTIPFLVLSVSESLVEQFNFVVSISSSLVLIVYLACALAYLKFLKEYQKAKPKHWLLGVASTVFCLWVLSSISLEMTLYSLTVFFVGIPLRMYMGRKI
jgi:amino acid transporter